MIQKTHKVVERTTTQQRPAHIDRDTGVIYGVKVCGNQSKNGRRYPPHVLEAAIPVYEGVAVYLDHGTLPGDERPLSAHFGNLRNIRVNRAGALLADLHYLRSHSAANAILERVERFPNNFGLSHDAEIESVMESGVQKVTRIVHVASVDLVTRPATNDGIFEQVERVPAAARYQAAQNSSEFRFRCFDLIGNTTPWHVRESADDPMTTTVVNDIEAEKRKGRTALLDGLEDLLLSIYRSPEMDRKAKLEKIDELIRQQDEILGNFSDVDLDDDGQDTLTAQAGHSATESYGAAQTKSEFMARCFD